MCLYGPTRISFISWVNIVVDKDGNTRSNGLGNPYTLFPTLRLRQRGSGQSPRGPPPELALLGSSLNLTHFAHPTTASRGYGI
jgi:hypothetical protein